MSSATNTQPARALPPVAAAMLESLQAHRLLTAGQLRELHAPHASLRWTHRALARLASHGLVDFARAGRGGRRVYHLTADGLNAVGAAERTGRPRRSAGPPVAGPLTAHTVAVNDAAIAFVTAARGRGDECGPLAWRHEVAHPTPAPAPGQRRALVIADALLTYLEHRHQGELAFHYRFVELDRATQPTNLLAAKLARYTDLHTYTPKGARRPAWQEHYPVFPEVLCVLTGVPRPVLERRAQTVLALYAAHPDVDPAVAVSICLLHELTQHGPWAPVFQRPRNPDRRVDWLGASA